jgi:hypothetical protein
MNEIDCIKFVDDATGYGVSVSVYQREDAVVLIDVQASDFRCLKSPASRWILSEWENRQLVLYALDPIRGKGQDSQRMKSRSALCCGLQLGHFSRRLAHAIAMPQGTPMHIRIVPLHNGAPKDISVRG